MGCFLRPLLRSLRNKSKSKSKLSSQERPEEKPPLRAPERGGAAPVVTEKRPVSDEPQTPSTANPPVSTITLVSSQSGVATDAPPYELAGSSPPTSDSKPVPQTITVEESIAEVKDNEVDGIVENDTEVKDTEVKDTEVKDTEPKDIFKENDTVDRDIVNNSNQDNDAKPDMIAENNVLNSDIVDNGIADSDTVDNSYEAGAIKPDDSAETDIWATAYQSFVRREGELATAYETHLTTITDADSPTLRDLTSTDWAKSTVKHLEEKRQSNQWKFSFLGRDIKVREQAEKLTKTLSLCDSVVKQALSAQPFAALAWSGVSILLPLLENASTEHGSMLAAFDSMQRVLVYWKIYHDAFPTEISVEHNRATWDQLVKLYSHIFEFQARVICHMSKTQLSRGLENATGSNDWENKAALVDKLSNDCKKCTDIAHAREAQRNCEQRLKEIYESRQALQGIHELLEDERRQRKSDRNDDQERALLSLLAANHEEYKNFNPPKLEGTCGWFLEDEHFCSWRDRSDSSLLWVSAGPGCGKSVLSRSLIDDWQLTTSPATSTVCHFFFKDGDQSRVHSHDALSAILHQLFIQDLTGRFMENALHRHKNYGDALRKNSNELWNTLLDCASKPDAGEIICVLDALDECREDERNIIVEKLTAFYSNTETAARRTCRLKFLITCRPYYQIERSINSLSDASSMKIDGNDKSPAISADINLVIDDKIPNLLGNFSKQDQERIAEHLKSMNNRTYLWLRLTFSIIEKNPVSYGKLSDVNGLLQELPEGHLQAYEKMLNQMNDLRHTPNLLQLILAANRPLSLDEANHALALADPGQSVQLWPRDSFKDIVKNFGGLLVDVHDSKISFIHQTVREFLTKSSEDDGKKWKWKGRFKPPVYHKAITRACIRCLSLPEQQSSAHGVTAAKDADAFYLYAHDYWTEHCRELDTKISGELLQKAVELCHVDVKTSQWVCSCSFQWTDEHLDRHQLKWYKMTDLAVAAYFGLFSVVRALIKKGNVNINAKIRDIGTALHMASCAGYINVIELLLDHGADIHSTSKSGETPLMLAATNAQRDAFVLLLDRGAGQSEEIPNLLVAAAQMRSSNELTAMILEKRGVKIQITPDLLVRIAEKGYASGTIEAIFDYFGDQVEVTPDVILAAARIEFSAVFMNLLFEKRGAQIEITQDVIEAASYSSLQCFRERLGDEIVPEETLLKAKIKESQALKERWFTPTDSILYEEQMGSFQTTTNGDVIHLPKIKSALQRVC
ncbi:hypothetical protein PFICI_03662 [Pestalotiopsis fici W106-1]|uniref:Uncharacterized protein n=1 Tax=Pestalotiopsis fici (strain W106-1 / CGMCC3.15140) TaxID=1229662 RepID=W3XJK3_PESFW|nr:uncharacterized protein PFICI_03662 [Pestalotiopsis fici W106-1]ETS85637.1 hypothetical protein PFICI_03662 [Pestalotiopsis fici W106-1]